MTPSHRHSTSAVESDFDYDVAGFGESMALFTAQQAGDLAQATQFEKSVSGADSNVATGLARLGFKVLWHSRVGADSFGRFIIDALQREGIDCSPVSTDGDAPTGFQIKSRREDGRDPEVESFRRDTAASRMSIDDIDDRLLRARHLHCTGIPPALGPRARELSHEAMRRMRAAGRSISFDTNLRPGLWPDRATMVAEVNALACLADWVLPGIEEGQLLTGHQTPEAIADFYLARGVKQVVIKLGADGAFYKDAGGERLRQPPIPVAQVVDTVGAGDGFAVGFISARLDGLDTAAAVLRGALIGARQVQVLGDSAGLPDRAALAQLLAARPVTSPA